MALVTGGLKLYPISWEDGKFLPKGWTRATTRAVATGEFRPPLKGEWYLSGAIVEAYMAPADQSERMVFRIARLVHGRSVLIFVDDEGREIGRQVAPT
jgi:hypothetical protein